MIEPFARYGFNKSHAVAYALVAYKTAYLKAHYPVDFLAATLSAEIGSTDGIVKVIGDCVEMGIPVLPPDINESSQELRGGRGGDPLRPRGGQGGRRSGGGGDPRRAAEGAVRLVHGLRPPAGVAPRQPAHIRRADRGRRVRLARAGRATLAAGAERVLAFAARRREEAAPGPVHPLRPRRRRDGDGPPLRRLPGPSRVVARRAPEGGEGSPRVLRDGAPARPRFAEAIERFADAKVSELAVAPRPDGAHRGRPDAAEEAEDQEGNERGEDDAEGGPRGHDRERPGLRSSRASTRRSAHGSRRTCRSWSARRSASPARRSS